MPAEADPLADAEALIAGGRAGEAVTLLDRLHGAGRGGPMLQMMRVHALIAAGDEQAALAVAREASVLYPGIAAMSVALGEALLAVGHLPAAIGEFQRALRLDPNFAAARYQLGCAWLAAGEAQKALDAFAETPAEASPDDLAGKIAEAEAARARPRSDPRYIRHLFDQFSAEYDARMLEQLGYEAPHILRNLAELIGLTRRGKLAILDLGCGTGLSGAAFADIASRLDGIDLSPAMIDKARARGIYDELRVADLETALAEEGPDYDLLLAADTFVYLGDLAPILRAGAKRLEPHGVILFSIERKDGEGFELGPKRRWRHSESYVRAQAAATGYEVAGILECQPRTEAGKPVEGYSVALEREAVQK